MNDDLPPANYSFEAICGDAYRKFLMAKIKWDARMKKENNMNPKAKLLYDQHDRKWLAERCVELDEFVELEISLKIEAIVKLTKLEAGNKKLREELETLKLWKETTEAMMKDVY